MSLLFKLFQTEDIEFNYIVKESIFITTLYA